MIDFDLLEENRLGKALIKVVVLVAIQLIA